MPLSAIPDRRAVPARSAVTRTSGARSSGTNVIALPTGSWNN